MKLEIKQTMEMYGTAYREAIIAKQKVHSEKYAVLFFYKCVIAISTGTTLLFATVNGVEPL